MDRQIKSDFAKAAKSPKKLHAATRKWLLKIDKRVDKLEECAEKVRHLK